MVVRRPLVIVSGVPAELPVADEIQGAAPAYCKVKGSVVQSIANGSFVQLTWDVEDYDVQAMHAAGSAGIVAPAAGWYDLGAHIKFAENATGFRLLIFQKNGVTVSPEYAMWPGGGTGSSLQAEERFLAAAGDTFTVSVNQNSGVALDVRKPDSFFSVERVAGL